MMASEPSQTGAPYLNAMASYAARGPGRFHVPGHKGGPGADPGLRAAIGARALLLDIPAGIYGIDLGVDEPPLIAAERLAAHAYGSDRSWFLTNGATQGNHALTLAIARPNTTVLLQRNSHASVVDGLVLSGGLPVFVQPTYDDTLGIAHGVLPADLADSLAANPQARAAFVVSPTYYGMAADIEGLAAVAHEAGVPLVVDQSWGPHFGFHPDVPASALTQGADAVLTSTHKMAGSLTQSAMLHVRDTGRVDIGAIDRALRLLRSTSQSALLLSSLDGARRQLALHGEGLLDRTLGALGQLSGKIATAPGITELGSAPLGHPGVVAIDPLKVVLDVRGTGVSGYEFSQLLGELHDVHPELATDTTVLLVIGLAERPEDLAMLGLALERTARAASNSSGTGGVVPPRLTEPLRTPDAEPVVAPRDAFLGVSEQVPLDEAIGRISCESIAGYPPGIPAILPGERITPAVVEHFRALLAAGAWLHGAADPSLDTITVLTD
jgi:arginine decarboxylase